MLTAVVSATYVAMSSTFVIEPQYSASPAVPSRAASTISQTSTSTKNATTSRKSNSSAARSLSASL